jgi:hypothetical protein
LLDRSGRGNHGTLTDMDAAADWVVDGGRYALDLDASNDYIDLGGFTVSQSQPLSLRWFEKVASTAGTFQSRFIFKTDGTRGFIVFRSTNATYLTLSVNGQSSGNYTQFSTAPSIANSVGIWREWVLVNTSTLGASSNPWRLWVDGFEYTAATGSFASAFGNANCRIGLDGLGDDPANCMMDEITVWNRSLSPAEVATLRQIGRGGMLTPRRRRRAYFAGVSGLRRRLLLTGQI